MLKLRSKHFPKNKYIRIVVAAEGRRSRQWSSKNWRDWHPLDLSGVITVAGIHEREGLFNKQEREVAIKVFQWFNDNVPVPPFKKKKKEWSRDCVCWWRLSPETKEIINKLRPLIKLLRKRGLVVRTLYTDRFNRVKYRDKFQVVVECRS